MPTSPSEGAVAPRVLWSKKARFRQGPSLFALGLISADTLADQYNVALLLPDLALPTLLGKSGLPVLCGGLTIGNTAGRDENAVIVAI